MIDRPAGTPAPRYDLNNYINEMKWGSLPLAERSVLVDLLRPHTQTPETCWFCVWDGWGSIDVSDVRGRVRLPLRDYVLYSGSIGIALATLGEGNDQSANLWWPDDHAWIVATEIDYAWTYVGGSDQTVESIVASDQIEALPAQLTDKPFSDADDINAALDARG